MRKSFYYISIGILGFFVLWGFFKGLEVHNLMSYIPTAILFVFIEIFIGVYRKELTPATLKISYFLSSVIRVSLISVLGTIASYSVAWGNTPVNTKIITNIDAFLGFNWVAFDKLFYSPLLYALARSFYCTLPIETLLVLLFLDKENVENFINFFTISLAITIIISFFIPVLPPVASLHSPTVEPAFMPGLMAAFHKVGTFSIGVQSLNGFDITKDSAGNLVMMGIVHLPSFHVVLACGYIYFSRYAKSKVISFIMVFLGIGLIISCMPIGTHHLIDVIGGIIVAGLGLTAAGQSVNVFCFFTIKREKENSGGVVKRKEKFLLWIIISITLLSYSFASFASSNMTKAKSSANSISNQFKSKYGSTGKINSRAIQPLMNSNAEFLPLNDNQSLAYHAQIECPSSKGFLQILFQPNGTNDFTAVISQDPQLTGHYTYQATTPLISGVCSNGFISCDAGTWNNCVYYRWALDSSHQLSWVQEASDANLGTCFCVNSSCGGNVFQQFGQIANTFGAGLSGFMATQQHFAVSNVKASFPTLTYYGQDAQKCTTVTGDFSGTPYNNPAQYYKNSPGLGNAVQQSTVSQINNENSPYYSAINSEYIKKNPTSIKTCEAKRTVYPQKVTGDQLCVEKSFDFTSHTHSGCDDPYQSTFPQDSVSYVLYQNYTCTGGSSDNSNITVYIPPGIQRYINKCSSSTLIIGNKSTDNNISISVNRKNHLNWKAPGTGGSGNCGYVESGSVYVYYPNSIWYCTKFSTDNINFYSLNKSQCGSECWNIELKETKNDTCSSMDTTGCKLKDKQVCDYTGQNCVYLVKEYNNMGVTIIPNCRVVTDAGTGFVWNVCADGNSLTYITNSGGTSSGTLESGSDVWWYVKKTYTCDAGQMTMPSLGREKNIEQQGTYDAGTGAESYPDATTASNGLGGYSGNYNAYWKYNGKAESCTYTCIVKENFNGNPDQYPRTSVVGGGGVTTNNPSAGTPQDLTQSEKYISCKKDVNDNWYCPISNNETIKQDCVCLDQGAQSIAVMDSLIQAAKDLTCSQE